MSARCQWAADAACASRLDLPWLADSVDVTAWESASMRAVCAACPVVAACASAVSDLDVTGGWWAGIDRDPCALDPAAGVPLTWRALLATDGHILGAQGLLDLDALDDDTAAA